MKNLYITSLFLFLVLSFWSQIGENCSNPILINSIPYLNTGNTVSSIDDYFAVLNCSTPERVPHLKLDWYFQTRASLKPPRVIWQRGHSNNPRYTAYSPDQLQHFFQIKSIHYNDSGTYMCVDQTTGFYDKIELLVRKLHCITSHILSFSHYPLENNSIVT